MRILLVDDHEVVLHGLTALLSSRAGFEVCGLAIDGVEAVFKVNKLRPDLVIMDLNMPGLNGLDATRKILAECPEVRVIVLTMHASEQVVRSIRQAGAHGYVLKSRGGEELLTAVEAIRNGRTFFSPIHEQVPRSGLAIGGNGRTLTSREKEVLKLLAEGSSNKEVGARLGISVKTAETHRSRIMKKLRLGSVADLVRYAIRNQYIDL